MAGEYFPPRSIPFLDPDGKRVSAVWYESLFSQYNKTGGATNNASELVVAAAATATTATAVPATEAAGVPTTESVPAIEGEIYVDTDTGTTYRRSSSGWDPF